MIAGEQLALFAEQLPENGQFVRGRTPRGHQTKGPGDLIVERGAAFLQHPFADQAGGFDDLGVVEQRERLQGRAGALAADEAHIALGRVEGQHGRRRHGPFPERVKTAPMQVIAAALFVFRVAHRDFPKPGRLIRFDARSADFFDQQSAQGEGFVAEHLRGQPPSGTTCEQFVFRVARQQCGIGLRGLPVGRGHRDLLQQRLVIPARSHEVARQPVEQFRMGRHRPLRTKVVARLHDAPPEHHLPGTIDRDPRHQRVLRCEQPLGETQAIARRAGRERWQELGSVRGDRLALRVVGASLQNVGGLW